MSPTGALLVTSIFAGEVSSRACSGAFIATALIREIHFGRSACILRKIFLSIVFYRIEPTIRYTLAMFFRKFPRFSGYSRPSSSTIRSALWENAHPSLAAVGLLLATAGGALLPTSVLSCSPRWSQERQHQKTVTNCICKPKQHS